MLVPKLRFKREDGTDFPDWDKTCAGDVFAKIKEKNKNGKNTNVITNSAEYGLINQRDFFDKDIAVEGKTNNYTIIKTNDFVYNPRKSSFAPFGAFNGYTLQDDGIVSPLYFCLRKKNNDMSVSFLFWYFKSSYWHRFIYENGEQGGARHDRVGVSEEMIKGIPIDKPCLEEQQKIADFLSTVDEVIAQSEAEVKNLEQQKKGVMQKIFSQEVRFKREDGTEFPQWEERELSYCFEPRDTKQMPTDEAPLMAFIAYKGVADKGDRYNRSYLIKTDNKKYKRTEYNDFIYSSNNLDVGSIGLNKYGTAVISVVYEIFKVKETAIPDFINALVQTPENMYKIIQYRQGCLYGQYKIFADDFLSVKTAIPCFEEQQKIADFLSAYDEAITYSKQELEKWKELKKGLLQQMFV